MKRLVQCSLLASFELINTMLDAAFTAIFIPCENLTY